MDKQIGKYLTISLILFIIFLLTKFVFNGNYIIILILLGATLWAFINFLKQKKELESTDLETTLLSGTTPENLKWEELPKIDVEKERSRLALEYQQVSTGIRMQSFKESSKYILIKNFVRQIHPGDLNEKSFNTREFVALLVEETGLNSESVILLIKEETKVQTYELFISQILAYRPRVYRDYIAATVDRYGDEAELQGEKLHQLLEDRDVTIPHNSFLETTRDIQSERLRITKSQLLQRLSEGHITTTIDEIDQMRPIEFENWVADFYYKKGFKITKTPITGDQGADLIIEKLGQRSVVQIKRYASAVGNKAVQEICAAIRHYNADSGIVLTNNYFTRSAIDLASSNYITLIDRNELKKMI